MTSNTNQTTRVAVTSRSFSRHPILRQELLQHYPNVTFNDTGNSLKSEALITFLQGHDKAIIALEKLDGSVFTKLPELKTIAKYGVGLDMLDLNAMAHHKIQLGWTPGVNRRSVSELVIAYAIIMLRHALEANRKVKNGIWKQHIGKQLSQRTVGIIGCGHVGKDLACLLSAFGCQVIAHDILDFPEFYSKHNITAMPLEPLLSKADIITLHLPFDDSTRNILNAERLALIRSDAILINIARGGLVDEQVLKDMLKNNQLAGAAFDVFATEPLDDMELINLPNFFVSPHIGGSAEEAILAMGRAAIKGLDNAVIPQLKSGSD